MRFSNVQAFFFFFRNNGDSRNIHGSGERCSPFTQTKAIQALTTTAAGTKINERSKTVERVQRDLNLC